MVLTMAVIEGERKSVFMTRYPMRAQAPDGTVYEKVKLFIGNDFIAIYGGVGSYVATLPKDPETRIGASDTPVRAEGWVFTESGGCGCGDRLKGWFPTATG